MSWETVDTRMGNGWIRYINLSADNVFVKIFIVCLIKNAEAVQAVRDVVSLYLWCMELTQDLCEKYFCKK